MTKSKKYVLLADMYDPTLMRNSSAFYISEKIGLKCSPKYKRVEVWVDGSYRGLYLLTENLDSSVNINKKNNEFFIEMDRKERIESDETYFYTDSNKLFKLRDPEIEDISEEQFQNIQATMNSFETAILSNDYNQISAVMDVDSFVDYYIINEYFKTIDFWFSSYFYYKNNIIYAGPSWDHDLSSGNCDDNYYGKDNRNPLTVKAATSHYYVELLKNPEFKMKIYNRYQEIRPILESLYIDDGYIDNQINEYNDAINRNYNLWNVSSKYSTFEKKPDATYEDNVSYLKDWLSQRLIWMDTYVSKLADIQDEPTIIDGTPYILNNNKELIYNNTVPHILINQVYGGKKKESYASHSFIELYNPLDEEVDLSGWSLQYRSSIDGGDNASWNKLDITGTIPAKSSYLVRCKSIKDPVEGSIVIDKFDQEWDQVINNKGCSVVLVANNDLIDTDSKVFDNTNGIPDILGYVDMVGVSGNDTDDDEVIAQEAALFYEKEASKVQSKKTGIRRKNLTDTDDNTVDGDFEAVDYSFDNTEYRAFIAPRCSSDGAWEFNEDNIPYFTVTYVNQPGEELQEEKYKYTSKVVKPKDPTRIGYSFTGWFEDKACAKAFNFKNKPTSDITLYAGWKANSYKVTYDTDGGSALEDTTYTYGTQISIPAEPIKEGFTFDGWYKDSEFAEEFEFGKMPAEDITIYAKWIKNTYRISFVTNDGSSIEDIEAEFGDVISKPSVIPTKVGYTFTGWYSDRTCETEYVFTTMPANNVVVYAGWKINQYTITFDTDGGSEIDAITGDFGSKVAEPKEPTKTGFGFMGWFDEKASETPYEFTTMPAKNIRLYARWTVNKSTISFETNGGNEIEAITGDYDSKVNEPKKPVKEGFAFAGWFADEELSEPFEFDTMPASDITVYAKWNKEAFRIRFITNGGSDVDSIEAEYGDEIAAPANEPVKEGYTFTGWYSDKTNETKFEFATMPASNVDVYAGWNIFAIINVSHFCIKR